MTMLPRLRFAPCATAHSSKRVDPVRIRCKRPPSNGKSSSSASSWKKSGFRKRQHGRDGRRKTKRSGRQNNCACMWRRKRSVGPKMQGWNQPGRRKQTGRRRSGRGSVPKMQKRPGASRYDGSKRHSSGRKYRGSVCHTCCRISSVGGVREKQADERRKKQMIASVIRLSSNIGCARRRRRHGGVRKQPDTRSTRQQKSAGLAYSILAPYALGLDLCASSWQLGHWVLGTHHIYL